ncbi:MAG: acyl--CoA ligase [Desulfuromonadales bacterium]|nr:acyl--CoA ligase [Desulfuromonadales bacterium]
MTPSPINLIHHFLEESAITLPDKCAVVHGNTRVSYKELNQDANRIACWLGSSGLTPGDRVVLLLENCREYIAGYYGCLKAGGVAVPLNPELKPENLTGLLSSIEPRAIISSTKCERALKILDFSVLSVERMLIARPRLTWGETQITVDSFEEITGSGDAFDQNVPLNETSLASIIFTSGSTGKPKGVMLSHRNIVANTRSIVSYLELTSADIQMVVLPFFYVMGKSLLNTHVAVGGTIVINNTFAYPASVIQQMIDEKVTGFSGVPSTYAYLLHRSPLQSARASLTSLRYCSQAGGHMARHTKEELLQTLPDQTKLYIMYGATEAAARLTYVEPHRLLEKIDSIGIPIPDVNMRVLNENGVALPQGETGELVASGPNIMPGYWNNPEETRKALSPHGYHTGDMGYQDNDGYFYVVGRRDNQLKVGGHRVNPQEIEDALIATNLVIECAVLGIPDQLAGHRLVAVTVPMDFETTGQEILSRCSKTLPRQKLPTEFKFLKSLPKNSSGKIDRGACMALFY